MSGVLGAHSEVVESARAVLAVALVCSAAYTAVQGEQLITYCHSVPHCVEVLQAHLQTALACNRCCFDAGTRRGHLHEA